MPPERLSYQGNVVPVLTGNHPYYYLSLIEAMFNLSVKYEKRGPLTQTFWDHRALKVRQTLLKLLEIFVNTDTDTAVLGNTDTEYSTDIKNTAKIPNTETH